jgi:hypothetical protein
MTPIRPQSGTEREGGPAEPAGGDTAGLRRGRHRKPRPRKVLLAAGGIALAAGVLSLLRVAPESGAGAPGTAQAESRQAPGGGATDRSAHTSATVVAAPTAQPSETSAMGGRQPAPTGADPGSHSGSPVPAASGAAAAPSHGHGTAGPAATPAGAPSAPGDTAPRPSATASAPRPAPTTRPPGPTPTHTHGPPSPDPGGMCVPVIGLCVDVFDVLDR